MNSNTNSIVNQIVDELKADNRIKRFNHVYINKPAVVEDIRNVDVNALEMENINNMINSIDKPTVFRRDPNQTRTVTPPRLYPIKRIVVRKMLDYFLQDYLYFEHSGFSQLELLDTKLYGVSNTYNCEDLIIGDLNGVPFRCSDVDAKSLLHKSTLYEFDFGKTFENDVILKKSRFAPKDGYRRFKTLNQKCNKAFHIFALEKYDTLLVLTPHVMEYLVALDQKYDGKVEISFVNKKMYIKFLGSNLFHISKFDVASSEKKIRLFQSQLDDLLELTSFLQQHHFIQK